MKRIWCIIGACEPGRILVPEKKTPLLIAADGGLRYLEEQGITPDLVVGDFDSLGRVPEGDNILTHPVEKDDTDTMLAVKLGLCERSVAVEIESILADYGFDLDCPCSAEALYNAALSDKKRAGGSITLILPEAIGQCVLYKMPCEELLSLLKQVL